MLKKLILICLNIYIKNYLYSSNIKWYYISDGYSNCKNIYENASKNICNNIDIQFNKKLKGSCCYISYINEETNKTINECEALIKKYAKDVEKYLLNLEYKNISIECYTKYLKKIKFYLLLLLLLIL